MTRIQVVEKAPVAESIDATTISSSEIRIDAGILIPGTGDPIKDGTIICATDKHSDYGKRGKILFAGSNTQVPSKYATLKATKVPVLMPGLWDCHVHLFGESSLNLEHLALLRPALAGVRCARDLAALLNAGFTSVREVGGYGVDIAPAVDEGWIAGPHIYAAGAPISQTAGHGDLHTQPIEFLHHQIQAGLPLQLADGVEEAIKAVRLQIRRGAKVIKICSTGGVMSRIDSPTAAQFTTPELDAMVEEARRTNLVVASHAHGTSGIIAALKAGVHTIEHGSYLTKEAIDLMIEKRAILVATRWIQVNGLQQGKNLPPTSFAKLEVVEKANLESYKAAIKAGVRIALGTDLGISNEAIGFTHGTNGREFGFAVEAGLSPIQAITAGTADAPATLGPQAPLSGQLKEGYDADFIALSENPVDDIDVLACPEKVTHVFKGSRCFKSPGKPVALC